MHDILSVAANSGNGVTMLDVIAFIVVPLGIAFVGGLAVLWRGGIRIIQYFTRSEEAQKSIAQSNVEIRDDLRKTREQLTQYAEKTDERLNEHDQELAVLNFFLRQNGALTGPRIFETVRTGNRSEASHA